MSDELPEERENVDAVYLSQRTQSGSGNSTRAPGRRGAHARTARRGGAALRAQRRRIAGGAAACERRHGRARSESPRCPCRRRSKTAAADARPAEAASEETLRLRGETRDELYVTADTRASDSRPTSMRWRRRVERIGTINYPSAAQRQGLSGNPVIEVVLQRDGKLQSARIHRSSGHPEIDAAALDILRLASPFDPFPPDAGARIPRVALCVRMAVRRAAACANPRSPFLETDACRTPYSEAWVVQAIPDQSAAGGHARVRRPAALRRPSR